MSEVIDQCEDELCLNKSSDQSKRVFPCLYHCKKMLCIKHLSEHDKYIENQIQFQKELEYLWKNYSLIFNEEKIRNEFQLLKTKLENYQQLSQEINSLLVINNFQNPSENNQKFQMAIQTVKRAIQQEHRSESFGDIDPKIELEMNDDEEEENQPTMDHESLSSSITTNNDTNGNSPSNEQENEYFQHINDSDNQGNSTELEHEDDVMGKSAYNRDENNVTSIRNVTASKVRGYCPLTQDGVFGINSHLHGIRLCPKKSHENQRTYCLHEHFCRVHHLTSLASLALARAIRSGQDSMTTRLFNDHHIILNVEELRTVICPMHKSLENYPLLHIDQSPCNSIKQVRHLKDHLRRVHKFTNKAASVILKAVKADAGVHRIEFPEWIDIIENDNHL